MAQATRTTCDHGGTGQVTVGGRPTSCRKCGTQIQPSPRAVDAGGRVVGSDNINAVYPGDGNTNDSAWAFGQ